MEPLSAWRRLARQAFLIVKAGGLARTGKLPFATPEELWADMLGVPSNTPAMELFAGFADVARVARRKQSALEWIQYAMELGLPVDASGDLPKGPSPSDINRRYASGLRQPDVLAATVEQWIEDGGGRHVRPVWETGPPSRPRWRTEVGTLYAAIGVGLWNMIGNLKDPAYCVNCGDEFDIREKRQAYCPSCQRIRKRDDQRRARERRAAQTTARKSGKES